MFCAWSMPQRASTVRSRAPCRHSTRPVVMRLFPNLRARLLAALAGTFLPVVLPGQTPSPFDRLPFRSIGPAVHGGRLHDVEALPNDAATVYVVGASSGVWKSTNRGITWESIFDDQPVSTGGDIAIFPGNSNILWLGTGEQN